jgi:hypothetical protein
VAVGSDQDKRVLGDRTFEIVARWHHQTDLPISRLEETSNHSESEESAALSHSSPLRKNGTDINQRC